jgi:hypothetical protein
MLQPTESNKASISAHVMFDFVGSAKTAASVFRCRLFMLALYDITKLDARGLE